MELIKVSTSKLKVVLSAEDMDAYGITSDELGSDEPRARQAFKRILDKARNETGFEKGGGRLYVRVFEGTDGGCELFVSKRIVLLPEPDDTGRQYRTACTQTIPDAYIAAVPDFDDLAAFCMRLREARFEGDSALYYYEDSYRLYLRFGRCFPSFGAQTDTQRDRFYFLSDHAVITVADTLSLAILHEHGECIVKKDAVNRIAQAAKRS